MSMRAGKIFLVGAGPGDPKLLTLRGKECLEQADVILYDYLANEALLGHAAPQAERLYVGRRGRGRYRDQSEINRLMIDRARAGKTVVRLKGGDPFVFGRGGEEAEAVAIAGLEFEVVPGVTAAVAAPAYAGIPVTHRTMASTVTFVTGHEDPTKDRSGIEWPRLAMAHGTLVFLMGMTNLPKIVRCLRAEGKEGTTPAAVIRWGTRMSQQTVVGTLDDIVDKSAAARLEPPTVIVVGEVVRLREHLNWFERRPLFGKRVLVTRPKAQAPEFSRLIAVSGGEAVECPTIAIVPPEDWVPLDRALERLSTYNWLIFTSANGIAPFMNRLLESQRDVRVLAGLNICCIGPRTAEALAVYGLRSDVIPAQFQAEGILEALAHRQMQGARVLIPRALVARDVLPDQLRLQGAEVDVVPVYRTIPPATETDRLMEQLRVRAIDVISFTSSSTVRNFVDLFPNANEMLRSVGETTVACIGPITAATAREAGLTVQIMAAQNTVPALADAIVQYVVNHLHHRPTSAAMQ
ncbi:MAG: hemD [Nitrospira sp.]|jgi:uroporphyrinogen III methyltransferase/synthase|nr:hemD [Nitrospira sp.]